MNIKDEIELIETTIRQAQNDLRALKKTCNHPTYEVGWWSPMPSSVYPTKICSDCHSNIGSPTQSEINAFMAQEKASQLFFLTETYGKEDGEKIFKSIQSNDLWTKI